MRDQPSSKDRSTRRDFMVGSLASGAALSASSVQAGTAGQGDKPKGPGKDIILTPVIIPLATRKIRTVTYVPHPDGPPNEGKTAIGVSPVNQGAGIQYSLHRPATELTVWEGRVDGVFVTGSGDDVNGRWPDPVNGTYYALLVPYSIAYD